ncbi:hypothetical protein [Rhizobium sp. LC145]|uniref:hypothetical protein n=1 Tax=Rhizobium sp. LC145 TaxID=1120688 RepID=UPI00062A1406|nr:hypothetical protein [Rhizobium sp. LC145]KKX27219.1 hypothetical protein YH62_22940 [Rhizobium sp. LC145]
MFETPARIEPLFFDDTVPTVLADIAIELQKAADELGQGLHPESAAELADLVRVMNNYYSNDYRERLFPNLFTDAEVPAPEAPALSFR